MATISDTCDDNPRRYEQFLDELWIEIFIRSSVESVVIVSCVCKHWYGLVNNSRFTHKHLKFQKMMSKKRDRILLQHCDMFARTFNYLLFDDISSSSYRNIFQTSIDKPYGRIGIEGPINGLYCLYNQRDRIVIWNPATNEVGFLPLIEKCLLVASDHDYSTFVSNATIGFGTDPLNEEDYKVILICECCTGDMMDDSVCAMLYTTKTNSWRFLQDDLAYYYPFCSSLNNTFLNGSYYWLGDDDCLSSRVFDMSKEETFRNVSIPCKRGSLALCNEHITMFAANKSLGEFDVWVMLEENNWIKTISVRGVQGLLFTSLGFFNNEDELLLVIDDSEGNIPFYFGQTVLYNTNNTGRVIKDVGPRGYASDFKALVYYESLVSLSGEIIKYKGSDRASLLDGVLNFLNDCVE